MSHRTTPATAAQLAYLRGLAEQTGTTFATPRDRRQASREIQRLRQHKKHHANRTEIPHGAESDARYATAVDPSEVEGWGASARWRSHNASVDTPRRSHDPRERPAEPEPPPAAATVRLGTYTPEPGASLREIVAIPVKDGTLIIDRRSADRGDGRLVGHLDPREPSQNAEILARLYLNDPGRGTCRPLVQTDLTPGPRLNGSEGGSEVRWDAPVIAGFGSIIRIQPVKSGGRFTVRWTIINNHNGAEQTEVVALRKLVAQLQDYEPAAAMSEAAIRAHREQPGCSTRHLAEELKRLKNSPIVLNRRLRERVEHATAVDGATMSEIALRCGRIRRSTRGREAGETSWLARRVGLLPEAGEAHPTPWVHTDVLALIARDGLAINPNEVEL